MRKMAGPGGIARRIEHFWKWRLRISLLENVSRQRMHKYGRSPVSERRVSVNKIAQFMSELTSEKVAF